MDSASIWKDALENPQEMNDATLLYYQIGLKTAYDYALLHLYVMLTNNYYFNILRT